MLAPSVNLRLAITINLTNREANLTDNNSLILHHYDFSPFAQKIRSMFGYCDLSWHSVISPPMPPRPNLDPLTGGYRKIPVLQVGADLFCDTRIITAEIAKLTERPELDRNHCSDKIQAFIDEVDLRVFFASAGSASPAKALTAMLLKFGPFTTVKFIKDRVGMAHNAKVSMPTGSKAQSILMPHYEKLEQILKDSPYLFGDRLSVADFSAYHVAWLAILTGAKPIRKDATHTADWYQRITDYGNGNRSELAAMGAFEIARDAVPRTLPKNANEHPKMGDTVKIAPSDYGRDAVEGKLIAANSERFIIQRDTERFGTLHVHFPTLGFEL